MSEDNGGLGFLAGMGVGSFLNDNNGSIKRESEDIKKELSKTRDMLEQQEEMHQKDERNRMEYLSSMENNVNVPMEYLDLINESKKIIDAIKELNGELNGEIIELSAKIDTIEATLTEKIDNAIENVNKKHKKVLDEFEQLAINRVTVETNLHEKIAMIAIVVAKIAEKKGITEVEFNFVPNVLDYCPEKRYFGERYVKNPGTKAMTFKMENGVMIIEESKKEAKRIKDFIDEFMRENKEKENN